MTVMKFSFIASTAPSAREAVADLERRYGSVSPEDADVIVALGGDGLMLQALHRHMGLGKPIYGMNQGTVGFMMNPYDPVGLPERMAEAEPATVHPLRMRAVQSGGQEQTALAINEVSLLRETRQAAKIRISIDGRVRLEELMCDGILLATPAGSTAYNLSAHGPILPIDAAILALTPISAFRPRRWRGALLPHTAKVRLDVLEAEKRPVSAVADNAEVRNVTEVHIEEDRSVSLHMLFDAGRSLAERVLHEQFLN
jgi:NAD+ kinase